jgi:hypothetical protein
MVGVCLLALMAQADFSGSLVLDLDGPPVRYAAPPERDPVARLQKRLDGGAAELNWDAKHGWLRAVLREFGIPVSSQVLVFSKTSLQTQRITPERPRAIYFNDDVYVGWVQNGDVIEVSTVDPERGGMFYALAQKPAARPQFERREECLQCHASPSTTGVPGHLVRSVYADPEGYPMMTIGSFVTDHRSPWEQRWGGWYVTGTHGAARHMGNITVTDLKNPEKLDREKGANVRDLSSRIELAPYVSPHSDVAALLVLEHQTKGHNLLARARFETLFALHTQEAMSKALKEAYSPDDESTWTDTTRRRIHRAAEVLVRYLLFLDEPPLRAPVRGTSAFAKEFAARGAKDAQGRTLRELDLNTRLFRYPLSFLVETQAFAELPRALRQRVWRRVGEEAKTPEMQAALAIYDALHTSR